MKTIGENMKVKYIKNTDSIRVMNNTKSILVEDIEQFYFELSNVFMSPYVKLVIIWRKNRELFLIGIKLLDNNMVMTNPKLTFYDEQIYTLYQKNLYNDSYFRSFTDNHYFINTEYIFDILMFNLYKISKIKLMIEKEIIYLDLIGNSKECIYSIMNNICQLTENRTKLSCKNRDLLIKKNKSWEMYLNSPLINYDWKKYF